MSLFPFLRYSHWDAARNGRSDGKINIPPKEQALNPPYIMQLKNCYEENIARLAQGWKRRDEKLFVQYCTTKQQVETLDKYLQRAETDLKNAKQDETHAQEEYHKHFHTPAKWYLLIALLIGLVEFPLNSIIFQVFGESRALTFAMAGGLAFVVPLTAHFFGGYLKQGVLRDGKFSSLTALIVCIGVLIVLLFVGVSYIREQYVEAAGVGKFDFATILVTFLAMNLLFFLVASILSYNSHDLIASKYYHNRNAAQKLKRNAANRVNLYEERLKRANERLREIVAARTKQFEQVQTQVKEHRDIGQKLISLYHSHNLRARANGEMPKCFETYPPIDVPSSVEPGNDRLVAAQLTWDCETIADSLPVALPPVETDILRHLLRPQPRSSARKTLKTKRFENYVRQTAFNRLLSDFTFYGKLRRRERNRRRAQRRHGRRRFGDCEIGEDCVRLVRRFRQYESRRNAKEISRKF